MNYYDIHTHILPQVDDGSKSVEQSLKLIELLKSRKINRIAFTPHYYSNEESLEDFLERRDISFKSIEKHLTQDMKFTLGAEVFYSDYLLSLSDISALCYKNTDYLLLEMGYEVNIDTAVKRVESLISKFGITPIFAHIERYTHLSKPVHLSKLIECGCLVQVNWQTLDTFFPKRHIAKLIDCRMVHFFGTDTHSENRGITDIDKHISWLTKKFGNGFMEYISGNSSKLFV